MKVFCFVQEIPRVFTQAPGFTLSETVSLILRDGETVVVKFCGGHNFLVGMRKLIRLYSIEETDVLFFEYVRESTFVLSIFKVSGMESKYIVDESSNMTLFDGVREEDIIKISGSSDEGNERPYSKVHICLILFCTTSDNSTSV